MDPAEVKFQLTRFESCLRYLPMNKIASTLLHFYLLPNWFVSSRYMRGIKNLLEKHEPGKIIIFLPSIDP